MAKHHDGEVTGGLTGAGGVLDGLNFGASREAKTPPRSAQQPPKSTPLNNLYKRTRPEKRSSKMNIMVKPSIAKCMDEDVENGSIKSRNDLINVLLEQYYEEQGRLGQ